MKNTFSVISSHLHTSPPTYKMSAPTTEYSNGRFRCPCLNEANYLVWANSVKVQMIANRCGKISENPQPPPARPAHINRDTPDSRAENRKLERE